MDMYALHDFYDNVIFRYMLVARLILNKNNYY
jgi:hypothetical protein